MSTLNFNVAGDPGDDVPVLIADNPPGGTTLSTHFEGVPGAWPNRFVAVVPASITGGATLKFRGGECRVIVPPGEGSWEAANPPCIPPEYHGDVERVALHYKKVTVGLSPLEPRGRYFWQDGHRFFLNGGSAFAAYERYLTGSDIRPFLAQRQELGFNAARIWTAYNIGKIGRLVPREVPGFYERIAEMNALCSEYGQYPYWTAFAGASAETLGDRGAMIEHQFRLQDALLRDGYPLLDLHNEFDNPPNRDAQFIGPNPPDGLLWSQGSNSQDVDPPSPFGRFYARHPGSSEWQRKVGKQNYDFAQDKSIQIPGVDDETVRVEPAGEMNLAHCYDAGQNGAFFVAGAFFHSAEAKLAVPFSNEYQQALAWCRGVASVPLEIVQDGTYFNRGDRLPEIIRVYEKIKGGVGSHRIEVRA